MRIRRLADRGALLGCAIVIDVGLAWLALYPAAIGVLQVAMVAICLTWRFRMTGTELPAHA